MITTIPNIPGFVLADENGIIRLAVMQRPPQQTLDNWQKIYADVWEELSATLDRYFPEET